MSLTCSSSSSNNSSSSSSINVNNTGPLFPPLLYSYLGLHQQQITSPSSSPVNITTGPVSHYTRYTPILSGYTYLYSPTNLLSTNSLSHQSQTPPAPIRYPSPSNGTLRDPEHPEPSWSPRLPWFGQGSIGTNQDLQIPYSSLPSSSSVSVSSFQSQAQQASVTSSSTSSSPPPLIRSLMTGFLLQLAAVHRCSTALLTLFNETPVSVSVPTRYLTPVQNRALVARAAVAATRLRRRRANNRAPATHLQRRRKIIHSFQKRISHPFETRLVRMAPPASASTSHQDIRRRRRSSVADWTLENNSVLSAVASSSIISTATATTATVSQPPPPLPTRGHSGARRAQNRYTSNNAPSSVPAPAQAKPQQQQHQYQQKVGAMSETMPSPPSRTQSFRGHSRSQSAACRQINRLSLTLPIALPTSDPSRPTPTSSTCPSIPPTPIDSTVTSPLDANEFIIAIAAQERRVLELREELLRAETDLTSLKRQWSQDAPNKRGELRAAESFQPASSSSDDETRRSVELDRRKMMLQNQNQPGQQNNTTDKKDAPAHNRRRVMRGGHTRTLSLLSPAKTEAAFSLHEDFQNAPRPQLQHSESFKLPPLERRTSQLINQNLAKRASWQPRTQQTVPTYPQIVEDFKLGLRAFVEDIRQITVGDEPISGQTQPTASTAVDYRNKNNTNSPKGSPGNQDTIKASQKPRAKVGNIFDSPSPSASSAKSIGKAKQALPEKERAKAGKNKHFSWTPLGFDAVDDDDWSNWESPSSVKTSRWSGSTIGNGGIDDIQNSEGREEQSSPS